MSKSSKVRIITAKSKTIFGRFISLRASEKDVFGRSKSLANIDQSISNYLEQDTEFILNVISISDELLFLRVKKGEVTTQSHFNENVNSIIRYIKSGVIISKDNILLDPGYFKIKQEEDLLKTGMTGVKGMSICPRCKKDNIVTYSKQKTSGDEGETLFNTCTDCNNKWLG